MFKMPKKKPNDRLLIMAIVFVAIVALMYIGKSAFSYLIKEESDVDEDWLVNNCDCAERERLKCPEGFELDDERKLCKKETPICPDEPVVYGGCEIEREVTNIVLGCSKYNCSEENYEFNFKKEKWQKTN